MLTRYSSALQVRAKPEDPSGVVTGIVAKYGVPYDIGGGMREEIARGAFTTSATVPVYLQHEHQAGPLGHATLRSDGRSLLATATLYIEDDSRARSVHRAMAAGALSEWSIGFTAKPEGIRRVRDTEIIEKGDLLEVSIVLRGAARDASGNPSTSTLSVRSASSVSAGIPDWLSDRLDEPFVRSYIAAMIRQRESA